MTAPDAQTTDHPETRLIEVAAIHQGDQLIRSEQDDDEITELAADIAAHGLMQAIGVRERPNGTYQLLYGARRLLAHKRLRRTHIRATIHPNTEESIRGIATRENIFRRPLTLQEESDVVRQMHEDEQRSPDQIASLLSRSRAWVLRRLAVHALPDDLRIPLLEGDLPLGHAEALAQIQDPAMRAYATNQIRTTKCSLGDCRAFVAAVCASPDIAAAVEAGIAQASQPAEAQPILMACAACGTARPLNALRIVRICDAGCPDTTTEHGGPTDA